MATWLVDAVLHAHAGPDFVARAVRLAQSDTKEGLVSGLGLDGDIHCVGYDRRRGRRALTTAQLRLGPTVTYRSAYDQAYGTGGGNLQTVHFEAAVTIDGLVLPQTALVALGGRHVSTIVEHPALAHPGLVIESAHQDTRGATPTGVSLLLPTLQVPVEAPRS